MREPVLFGFARFIGVPPVPPTLDEHVQNDPRILKVYMTARRLFEQENLPHHNFDHTLRDLHRALVIAADEESVDYRVLIPAVLLHDIGFCRPDHVQLGHDVAGELLAREILIELGYEQTLADAICHCVRAHKARSVIPQTIEAKITCDADVLEKSGVAYLLFLGKILFEFDEKLDEFMLAEMKHKNNEVARNFFTAKAREIDGGRLAFSTSLLAQMVEELTETRPDFMIRENAFWKHEPPVE